MTQKREIKRTPKKRALGQFYTRGNPFTLSPFKAWAECADLAGNTVLEPFAGANHIIYALQKQGWAKEFASFDIAPHDSQVRRQDTLKKFPKDYQVIVTNPPWLAKNSATRRGLPYPLDSQFDDLYKHCLHECLRNAPYVAALIPASYLQSGLFRNRLHSFIALHDRNLFCDTDNPVALALFTEQNTAPAMIYNDNKFIGTLDELEKQLPPRRPNSHIRFNDPDGELGFIAFDNTRTASIRFCKGEELQKYSIGHSTRMITRIAFGYEKNLTALIEKLNAAVSEFRDSTQDIFLTPFKGLRKDGHYRRRMEFALARQFITCYR